MAHALAKTPVSGINVVREVGIVCMTGIVGNKWSFDNFAPMEAIPTAVCVTVYAGESGISCRYLSTTSPPRSLQEHCMIVTVFTNECTQHQHAERGERNRGYRSWRVMPSMDRIDDVRHFRDCNHAEYSNCNLPHIPSTSALKNSEKCLDWSLAHVCLTPITTASQTPHMKCSRILWGLSSKTQTSAQVVQHAD
jgi:hypothetical protein